jgi:hypothetical protein
LTTHPQGENERELQSPQRLINNVPEQSERKIDVLKECSVLKSAITA